MNVIQQAINTVDIEQASKRINRSQSWIYDRLNPKSPNYDPSFPRPVKFFGRGKNVFVDAELDTWLSEQIQRSRCGQERPR